MLNLLQNLSHTTSILLLCISEFWTSFIILWVTLIYVSWKCLHKMLCGIINSTLAYNVILFVYLHIYCILLSDDKVLVSEFEFPFNVHRLKHHYFLAVLIKWKQYSCSTLCVFMSVFVALCVCIYLFCLYSFTFICIGPFPCMFCCICFPLTTWVFPSVCVYSLLCLYMFLFSLLTFKSLWFGFYLSVCVCVYVWMY